MEPVLKRSFPTDVAGRYCDPVSSLLAAGHSPIRDYIVPGLDSWLVGTPSLSPNPYNVRLFHMTRNQTQLVTPHSHRRDLFCTVLSGSVENRLYLPATGISGEEYYSHTIFYRDSPGCYVAGPPDSTELIGTDVGFWRTDTYTYEEGQSYYLEGDAIHSIVFKRGTVVMVVEVQPAGGPRDSSIALLPWRDGRVLNTLAVQPWMFHKE